MELICTSHVALDQIFNLSIRPRFGLDQFGVEAGHRAENQIPEMGIEMNDRARRPTDDRAIRVGAARRINSRLVVLAFAMEVVFEDVVKDGVVNSVIERFNEWIQICRIRTWVGLLWNKLLDNCISLARFESALSGKMNTAQTISPITE